MKRTGCLFFGAAVSGAAFLSEALAIPMLQLGAPGEPGEGTYADYLPNSTNPEEEDTAVTFGTTIFVAGAYHNKTTNLGGQYGGGDNWSAFGLPAVFDGHGAVLLASVPKNVAGFLTIDLGSGPLAPFYTSATESFFPNNHDPVKPSISDFLFFDIGDFSTDELVPNFVDETGAESGEMKTIQIHRAVYPWVHFDVLALETIREVKPGRGPRSLPQTSWATNLAFNPGSHDVTDPEHGINPPTAVPEPMTMVLVFGSMVAINLSLIRPIKRL